MPKPRQPLNELQTEILLVLYKFRFATRDLIVSYQDLASRSYTQRRLVNLMQQEYIARKYSGKDKIAGKPAKYYLDNRGIRFLLDKERLVKYGLNPKVLNLIYKDKNAHEQFIELCLDIFKLHGIFTKLYGNNVDFYTKSEIAEYDHFLKPLPDAYVTFSGKHKNEPDYIVEFMSKDKPYFVLRRRINQYLQDYSNTSWQKKTGTDYPSLLLIADSPNLERRLQKSIAFSLNSRGIHELCVYTTTNKSIFLAEKRTDKILSNITKPEVLVSL
jgi:hypothetical protein